MSSKAIDKLSSAEAEKVEERFTAGERNSPAGYFERRKPRAWASGARPQ